MRRTVTFGVIGTAVLTLGLGTGIALAATNPVPPDPATEAVETHRLDTMDMTSMMNGEGMANMMNGNGMANMMNGNGMANMMNGEGMANMMNGEGMDSMHSAMHAALSDTVSADVLADCDAAHAAMSDGMMESSTGVGPDHAAHHD